jgi:hypothetical protein
MKANILFLLLICCLLGRPACAQTSAVAAADDQQLSGAMEEASGEEAANETCAVGAAVVPAAVITGIGGVGRILIATISPTLADASGTDSEPAEALQEIAHPQDFILDQNYPNPFNPTTSIQYALPQNAFVTLKVYNVLGQVVSTLVNAEQSAGYKSVNFNATNLPSGVYLYRIQAGTYSATKKLLLMK